MAERLVYADNAATTSTSPAVLEAMMPYFGAVYGNPSCLHQKGREAKAAITAAQKVKRPDTPAISAAYHSLR